MEAEPLLIGSGNRDKAAELRTLLADLPWNVTSLADLSPIEEPEETGETFEANALLKAHYYAAHAGVSCVADDSGLEVDALEGAPGVYSARYAGEQCSYADNNAKLLGALEGMPAEKRTARFVCVAAFATLEGESFTVRGTVEGRIAFACAGANGFGYDPLFIARGESRTFGEMAPEEKHAISHRGRAFRALRDMLAQRARA